MRNGDTLYSEFHTFGEPTGVKKPHILSVYAIGEDGETRNFSYDVTDQVTNAPDPRHVDIVVEGLVIPRPLVNGGGLHPAVDEWEEESHDLEM